MAKKESIFDAEIVRVAAGLPDNFIGRMIARRRTQKLHDAMTGGPRVRFPGSEWLAEKALDMVDRPAPEMESRRAPLAEAGAGGAFASSTPKPVHPSRIDE